MFADKNAALAFISQNIVPFQFDDGLPPVSMLNPALSDAQVTACLTQGAITLNDVQLIARARAVAESRAKSATAQTAAETKGKKSKFVTLAGDSDGMLTGNTFSESTQAAYAEYRDVYKKYLAARKALLSLAKPEATAAIVAIHKGRPLPAGKAVIVTLPYWGGIGATVGDATETVKADSDVDLY